MQRFLQLSNKDPTLISEFLVGSYMGDPALAALRVHDNDPVNITEEVGSVGH